MKNHHRDTQSLVQEYAMSFENLKKEKIETFPIVV